MVVIHVKRAEDSMFLFEAPVVSDLVDLVPSIATIYNLRLRIGRLLSCAEEFIKYGPLKPDNEQGYTEEQLEKFSSPDTELPDKPRNEIYKNGFMFYDNPDPSGRRVGQAMGEAAANVIVTTLNAATDAISKDQITKGVSLKLDVLKSLLDDIRGAFCIVHPEGFPEWEPLRDILEDTEDLSGTAASKEIIDSKDASIWWANKELQREKKLCDYIGKNDKTKIIVKLQKRGQGPPLREAPISEQQQKEMMAYYYRKQEEQKKLAENDEDEYLNSSWADTKALKSAFNGMQGVKWRAF
ncbi:hypothetical protein RTP6_005510 [Batrachochytrium dendrobatidis]